MIWGTTIAPAIQQQMAMVFVEYVRRHTKCSVYVYLDDFVVAGHTPEECKEGLELLEKMLTEAGLELNRKKSQFEPRE